MLRPSPSLRLARQSLRTARSSHKLNPPTRRYLTTEPPHKTSRSWKNSATRWAIAIGGVYWYNTTPLFAEPTQYTVQHEEVSLPTLESLSKAARFAPPSEEDLPVLPVQPSSKSPPSLDPKSPLPDSLDAPSQTPADLESEAASQGAFNEETGEINWDCPCLGGMAHGPCGPEFREAFSCFVFSKEEPKGMDCVDKFKGMQTCFREHPDEYGDQLEEDEEEIERELAAREGEGNHGNGAEGEGISAAAADGVATALKEELKQDGKAGGVGDDASEALDKSKKDSPAAAKRSIYDSEPESKTSSKPSSSDSTGKPTAPSGKSDSSRFTGSGDEGENLVPKAALDATTEGIKTSK